MVVYEIKDPKANVTRPSPKPVTRRDVVVPTFPITPGKAIDMLSGQRQWGTDKDRKRRPRQQLNPGEIRDVRRLLADVNHNLDAYGVLLHLVLVTGLDGSFGIDVYDCSNGQICKVIHDMMIGLDELPKLLASLQKEVGIMVNTTL